MANALAISPAIMINRMVVRSGVPQNASMGMVAQLRMALEQAVNAETARSAALDPEGQGEAPVLDNGAAVDRLI